MYSLASTDFRSCSDRNFTIPFDESAMVVKALWCGQRVFDWSSPLPVTASGSAGRPERVRLITPLRGGRQGARFLSTLARLIITHRLLSDDAALPSPSEDISRCQCRRYCTPGTNACKYAPCG